MFNIINVAVQIYLIDNLLGGEFSSYGFKVNNDWYMLMLEIIWFGVGSSFLTTGWRGKEWSNDQDISQSNKVYIS